MLQNYKKTLYSVRKALAKRFAISLPIGRFPFSISEIWLGSDHLCKLFLRQSFTRTKPAQCMTYMEIELFEWDEDTIVHIANHGISPEEIEEVAFENLPYIPRYG
jgi:hypothetical protein